MSLFIGGLSFADQAHMNAVRLGVLSGSAVSAILGYALLYIAAPRNRGEQVVAADQPAPVIHH